MEPRFRELREERLREVEGKTLLVVGLGGIGTEVAKRAHALGMHVLATRNSRREGPDYVEYVGLADEYRTLAARADVVVNATPLTPETRGMFDAQFFDAMKDDAFFINIGRGESVVTAALPPRSSSTRSPGPRPLPAGLAALRAGGAGRRQAARRRHRLPTGPRRASRRSIR